MPSSRSCKSGRSPAGEKARHRIWRQRLSQDGGAVTLSYVIIVPVFLFAILVVVQASVLYLAKQTALAAARHGADVARTATPPSGAGGSAAAVAFARSAGPGFLTRVSARSDGTATTVKITVSGQAFSLIPGKTFPITEVVTAPVERFVALGGSSVVRYDRVR